MQSRHGVFVDTLRALAADASVATADRMTNTRTGSPAKAPPSDELTHAKLPMVVNSRPRTADARRKPRRAGFTISSAAALSAAIPIAAKIAEKISGAGVARAAVKNIRKNKAKARASQTRPAMPARTRVVTALVLRPESALPTWYAIHHRPTILRVGAPNSPVPSPYLGATRTSMVGRMARLPVLRGSGLCDDRALGPRPGEFRVS